MRVLVTGASGLIGRPTVSALLAEGHEVRTYHRGGPLSAEVPHVQGDVAIDVAGTRAAAQGCEAVVHLAGRGDVAESRREPLVYARLNADGALHALEAARHAGAAFVLASTQRIYPLTSEACREDCAPAPDSPYGYAKLAAELWCRMESEQFGVPCTVLRFFSVYGPGQQPNGVSGVVSIFARAARAGLPLQVHSAGRRDFTDARDAARGIALALRSPSAGYRVFNLATGIGTSFRALAECVVAAFASPSVIEESRPDDAGQDLVADISRARCALGYQPSVPLVEGLAWYRTWLETNDGA